MKTPERDTRTGRYRPDLDRLCSRAGCGHEAGDHLAAAPHGCTGKLSDGRCSCPAFQRGAERRRYRKRDAGAL